MQTETVREDTPHLANSASTSQRDSDDTSSIDLLELARVLRKNMARIGLASAVGLAIGIIIAFAIPKSYTATASIIPPNSTSGSLGAFAGQLSSLAGVSNIGATKNTDLYVGILGSYSIAQQLVSRFDLMHVYKVKKESAAVRKLAKASTFEAGVRDGIVTIQVTDHSPERARDLANAYLEELHNTSGRLALTEASQRRLFFQQQLAKEKDDLENAEVDLKKVEQRTGMIAPAGQTTIELETIAQTRAEIARRQVELAALRQSSTEQNPEVVRLESELRDLNAQLTTLENGSGQTGATSLAKADVPEIQLEYVRQQREVQYHETLFDALAKQFEQARLDESHDAPVLQVLDYPTIPDTKSGPPRTLIILAGLILGAFIGVAEILIRQSKFFAESRLR